MRRRRHAVFWLALAACWGASALAPRLALAVPKPWDIDSYRVDASVDGAGNLRVQHSWQLKQCVPGVASETSGTHVGAGVMIVRYCGATPTITAPSSVMYWPGDIVSGGAGRVVRTGCASDLLASKPGNAQYCDNEAYRNHVEILAAAPSCSPATRTFTYVAYTWQCEWCNGINGCPGPAWNNNSNCAGTYLYNTTGVKQATVTLPSTGVGTDWAYTTSNSSLRLGSYLGLGVMIPGASGLMEVLGDTGGELWGDPPGGHSAANPELDYDIETWPMVATLKNGSRVVFGIDNSDTTNYPLYAINARNGKLMWATPKNLSAAVGAPPVVRMVKGNPAGTKDILYVGTSVVGSLANKIYAAEVTNTAWVTPEVVWPSGDTLGRVTGILIDYDNATGNNQIIVASYAETGTTTLWCVKGLVSGTVSPCTSWPSYGITSVNLGDLAAVPVLRNGKIWVGNLANQIYYIDYIAAGAPVVPVVHGPYAVAGPVQSLWPEWRSSIPAYNRLYVRTKTDVLGYNQTNWNLEVTYHTGSPTGGPTVNGPDGYLVFGANDGKLHRKNLDNSGEVLLDVCPVGVTCSSVGDPMLAFPDYGSLKVVAGSSGGYSGRFTATGGTDPDGDHDGWPNTADNCSQVYNPRQSRDLSIFDGGVACAPPVTLGQLDTTFDNRLTADWWFEGQANCKTTCTPPACYPLYRQGANPCGTELAPKKMIDDITFTNVATDAGVPPTAPSAEVTWGDGPDAVTRGPIRIAIRNLYHPYGGPVGTGYQRMRICQPNQTTCGSGCTTTLDPLTTVWLGYFRLRADDLTPQFRPNGFNGPNVTRRLEGHLLDGGTPETVYLLGGQVYLEFQVGVEYRYKVSILCQGASTYTTFRGLVAPVVTQETAASPNPDGGVNGSGIVAIHDRVNKTLELRFNLANETQVDFSNACWYDSTRGGTWLWSGFKNLRGQLKFKL